MESSGRPGRLAAIDALRGGIMIIMALDHVRDFFHRAAMTGASPTDLAATTPLLFMTRWVTHFCAPVFAFTAGLGAFFWWHHGRSRSQLSGFLITRGLWLIVLELTVMQFAYYFTFSDKYPYLLLVLWVLGLSMVGLAALIWLPIRWLAVLCVAMIVLHNGLDGIRAAQLGGLSAVWKLLHQQGVIGFGTHIFIVGYPLVPWIAVMGAGFCCGPLFLSEPVERQRRLTRLGAALTAAFVVVRAINIYGDPAPWSPQPTLNSTVLSFLNTTKYPPSLDFLLMTMGPALMVLAWLDRVRLSGANPLIVFGRVPLFYFIVHFFLAHAAIVALSWVTYGSAARAFMFHPVPSMGGARELFPPGFGYDLWITYVMWALIVAAMYPACRWFAQLKERRRDWWLSYL